uniref:Transcription initiation factor TFIID subunit 1 histone acetyltransferase domain-containing protein n=1 Tax=Romanomermis culicivorax TaxID=13658 RepID=A0A915JXI0_ROMCU
MDHQFTKKSQLILGRVAQRQREEEEEAANLHMTEKDNFNLSNDDYYRAKSTSATNNFSGSMIQHSIPAQNLMQPFFNTYFNVFKLRHFHRLPMKKFGANKSILSKPIFHSVNYLERYVAEKSQ